MSEYSQAQEYRLIRHLKKLGAKVLEYYGSRRKHKGDVLSKIGETKIRFDHKSTRNERRIGFDLKWLLDLDSYCDDSIEEDGVTYPAISFSFLNSRKLFVGTTLYVLGETTDMFDWFPNKVNDVWLKELEHNLMQGVYAVDSKEGSIYFYSLEAFVKQLRGK